MASPRQIINKAWAWITGLVTAALLAGGITIGIPRDIGTRTPERVWSANNGSQVTGMIGSKDGLFVNITYSFSRSGYNSEIWRSTDGRGFARVWSGPVETVGQGMVVGDEIHWPVEHGDKGSGGRSLVWKDGRVQGGPKIAAPWSITSGEGYIPYNDGYTGGRRGFNNDKARWVNVASGKVDFRSEVPGFVRSIFRHMGSLAYTVNYADPKLVVGGKAYPTRMLKAGSRGNQIFGGGGVDGAGGGNDGGIYLWEGGKEKEIGRVGGQSCEAIYADDNRVLLGFINPDEIVEITRKGEPRVIASIPGDRRYTGGWAFGAAIAKWDGKWWWARSDNSRVHVYRMD